MSGSSTVTRIATFFVSALVCAAALARNHSDFAVTTDAAKVKHVFVIVLENKSYSDTFGTSTQDPYLQKTLVPMGALLTEYYGTGHVSLDNYISMLSGQGATRCREQRRHQCRPHSAMDSCWLRPGTTCRRAG